MDRLDRYAPLSGVAFVLLFAVGNALWAFEQPAVGADPGEIVDFYEDTSTGILIGGSLSLLSIGLLVWFGSILRDALGDAASGRAAGLPQTAFAGVVLVSSAGLAAETINMVGALRAEDDGGLTPAAAQTYLDVSSAFGYWAAGAAGAIAVAATAVVAIATRKILPPYVAWMTLAATPVLVTPILITPAGRNALGLPLLFVAGVSIALYRQNSRAADQGSGTVRQPRVP